MSNTLRIAILECDTPIDPIKQQYGTYGDVFATLLKKGLAGFPPTESKPSLEVTKWDVVDKKQYPKLEDIDGILMTGSSE